MHVHCYDEIHDHGQWIGMEMNVIKLASAHKPPVTPRGKSCLNHYVSQGPAQFLLHEVVRLHALMGPFQL